MSQMVRFFRLGSVMWLIMIAIAAYGLYFVKYKVQELQRQIASVEGELQREYEHLHVIEAEWAYLTRPDRLQALVNAHTALRPVAGVQVQQVAVLPFPPAPDEESAPGGVFVAGFQHE